jgi:hypothetical protein
MLLWWSTSSFCRCLWLTTVARICVCTSSSKKISRKWFSDQICYYNLLNSVLTCIIVTSDQFSLEPIQSSLNTYVTFSFYPGKPNYGATASEHSLHKQDSRRVPNNRRDKRWALVLRSPPPRGSAVCLNSNDDPVPLGEGGQSVEYGMPID